MSIINFFSPTLRDCVLLSFIERLHSFDPLCPFVLCIYFVQFLMKKIMQNLSLSKEEEDELVLEIGDGQSNIPHQEFCFIGRFLIYRPINFNIMKNRIASIWRPRKGLCVKKIKSNLFLFQIFHHVDLKRLIEGGPWTFDNYHLSCINLIQAKFLLCPSVLCGFLGSSLRLA